MSATTQPMTGQANQTAPFGALAVLVGALALGAVGIALGQGYKAAPAAVPADVQAALYAQRMGEKASLFSAEDPILIQHRGGAQRPGEGDRRQQELRRLERPAPACRPGRRSRARRPEPRRASAAGTVHAWRSPRPQALHIRR